MKINKRVSVLLCVCSSLIGCAAHSPAPVSSVSKDYGSISRGSYRGSYYEVKKGDTLYFIAYVTDKDVKELIQYNKLSQPYTIHPGQKLKLWGPKYSAPVVGRAPNKKAAVVATAASTPVSTPVKTPAAKPVAVKSTASTTPVVAKTTPTSTAQTTPATTKKVVAAPVVAKAAPKKEPQATPPPAKPVNKQAVSATPSKVNKVSTNKVEQSKTKEYVVTKSNNTPKPLTKNTKAVDDKVSKWLWPTKGRVIKNFSSGEQGNNGIDIGGQRGQSIISTAAGSVVYSGNALRGYGNLIIIKHNDKYLSAYAHNDKLLVKEGQTVNAGQKIATMGSSGSTSVRLHFEIRYQGKSVNPKRYLP
ncbi:hypothetical protein BCU68_12650 [Vibrio sp. 10N.286.49.B3]|uniref:peptidoglycan DD-metalloendopeptidase family protein n=1 Tax=Vibrio sp. 10N.286.49.B3 TaxID=1880855 RepID=UPI000C8231DF|nr:peptidoglycan DD-metalloendopeptidase family protein [Vibrio sp. 10N.286.49.B3]PMH43831.1 hypothetical protein BCU68_12650 [Vibrio sp. 10N.286.49.B3]